MHFAALWLASLAPQLGTSTSASQAPLAPASTLGAKPARTELLPDHAPGQLEVKFAAGSGVRIAAGRLMQPEGGAAAAEAQALALYLDTLGAELRRTFDLDDAWLAELEARGEARTGRDLHDLTLFGQVLFPLTVEVGEVCDVLNGFAVVELAYPVGGVSDPSLAPAVVQGMTPDFEPLQEYRRAAPDGIDADYASRFGGASGRGTMIGDVETGWTHDHEDIAHAVQGRYVGLAPTMYPWNHGTATLGELVGQDNGLGIRGIVPNAAALMSSHQGTALNVPVALMHAVAAVQSGDVILLEVQCYGQAPGYYPCEFVPSTYAMVETAVANGIQVYAAAGNSAGDLGASWYRGLFDRSVRDSGAVIVGASDGALLIPSPFSNYGSRVDLQGWGRAVTTCGYGDLYWTGSDLDSYTQTFSGTSSATPIVAGAGIALNGVHRAVYGVDMDPVALRQILVQTGTPQTGGNPIGPRPDLRRALAALGVPRLELLGPATPGSSYRVIQHGRSGSPYYIAFAPTLRTIPLQLPPYGEFFLAAPMRRIAGGLLGAEGKAAFLGSIPNDPALVGTTLGYFQGWERFPGSSTGGAFTNYEPLTVQ